MRGVGVCPAHDSVRSFDMPRLALVVLFCLSGSLAAHADALDETLQPFCSQSGIAPPAC